MAVNKVILIGNVGQDPEIKSTQDGKKIANFSIGISESWKDKHSGELNKIKRPSLSKRFSLNIMLRKRALFH